MADKYVSSTATGGGVGSVGDPWTIDEAASNHVSADTVWVKADGTHNLGSTLTVLAGSSAYKPTRFSGYTSTTGDGGVATVSCTGVGTGTSINLPNSYRQRIENLSLTNVGGIGVATSANARVEIINVRVNGTGTVGIQLDSNQYGVAIRCYCTGVTTGFKTVSAKAQDTYDWCVADGCTTGFAPVFGTCTNCCAINNSGVGFSAVNSAHTAKYCLAYGNTGNGWDGNANTNQKGYHESCMAIENGGYGWDFNTVVFYGSFKDNAGFSNTSGDKDTNPAYDTGFLALGADPFVDGANNDFTLTSAAKTSANADYLKRFAAGLVGSPVITTDSLADLFGGGSGGGLLVHPGMTGGINA